MEKGIEMGEGSEGERGVPPVHGRQVITKQPLFQQHEMGDGISALLAHGQTPRKDTLHMAQLFLYPNLIIAFDDYCLTVSY